MEIILDIDNFDLENSLLSSFACYLFEQKPTRNGSKWVGLVDPIRNVELSQKGNQLNVATVNDHSETLHYVATYVTGLWHTPQIVSTDNRTSEIIELLSRKIVPGVRVPKLFKNKWHVLVSAMLSIHARTHLSRLWFTYLNELMKDDYIACSPTELSRQIKEKTGKSPGFRIRFIAEMVKDLHRKYPECDDPLDFISDMPPPVMRRELLSIENIGPKVCDCFLLNAVGDVDAPPVDIHVKRVSEYLGILPPSIGYPLPMYCAKYTCSQESSKRYGIPLCPETERTLEYLENLKSPRGTCMRAALNHAFKNAGWVQALLFLFGKRYCVWKPRKGPSCELCPLNNYCSAKGKEKNKSVIVRPTLKQRVMQVSSYAEPLKIPLFDLYPAEEEEVRGIMKEIQRKIIEKGIGLKVKSNLVSATCLLLACRLKNLPVIAKEVAEKSGIKVNELLKMATEIRTITQLKIHLPSVISYCERVSRALNVPEYVTKAAGSIIQDRRLRENAMSIAAAVIYSAAKTHDLRITKKILPRHL